MTVDVKAYGDLPPCVACDTVGFVVPVDGSDLAPRWICVRCGYEQDEAPAAFGARSDPDV
jgi:hypothetical protein